MVLLSHSYMTTGKTIALTIGTFVGKAMPLLFFVVVVFSFFLIYFIFKLYIIVLVLPNIKMNPPQVWDGMGREEGGGFRMGNTCIPVADSF